MVHPLMSHSQTDHTMSGGYFANETVNLDTSLSGEFPLLTHEHHTSSRGVLNPKKIHFAASTIMLSSGEEVTSVSGSPGEVCFHFFTISVSYFDRFQLYLSRQHFLLRWEERRMGMKWRASPREVCLTLSNLLEGNVCSSLD